MITQAQQLSKKSGPVQARRSLLRTRAATCSAPPLAEAPVLTLVTLDCVPVAINNERDVAGRRGLFACGSYTFAAGSRVRARTHRCRCRLMVT
jgi:hypothetical protein